MSQSGMGITPLGAQVDYSRCHTFWRRFLAGFLDGLVLTPLTFPTSFLIGYGSAPVAITWVILVAPVGWLYTSYCHGRWGQTLGKRALNIKVVRAEDEQPISYARAFRRDAHGSRRVPPWRCR